MTRRFRPRTLALFASVGIAFAIVAQGEVSRPAQESPIFAVILHLHDDGAVGDATCLEGSYRPESDRLRFWGLSTIDAARTNALLKDRPLRCRVVVDGEIPSVDCVASPRAGRHLMKRGANRDWINIFEWLPEFGLASRACAAPDRGKTVHLTADLAQICDELPFRSHRLQ
jgi:hypothetical protein